MFLEPWSLHSLRKELHLKGLEQLSARTQTYPDMQEPPKVIFQHEVSRNPGLSAALDLLHPFPQGSGRTELGKKMVQCLLGFPSALTPASLSKGLSIGTPNLRMGRGLAQKPKKRN